jgi:hypothetical protein
MLGCLQSVHGSNLNHATVQVTVKGLAYSNLQQAITQLVATMDRFLHVIHR